MCPSTQGRATLRPFAPPPVSFTPRATAAASPHGAAALWPLAAHPCAAAALGRRHFHLLLPTPCRGAIGTARPPHEACRPTAGRPAVSVACPHATATAPPHEAAIPPAPPHCRSPRHDYSHHHEHLSPYRASPPSQSNTRPPPYGRSREPPLPLAHRAMLPLCQHCSPAVRGL